MKKLLILLGFALSGTLGAQNYSAPASAGTGGSSNVFLGDLAGSTAAAGNSVFVGREAGKTATSTQSVFLGSTAGKDATGNSNVFIGYGTGSSSAGVENIFLGSSTGAANQGKRNVFMGWSVGQNNTGDGNVAVGWRSGLTHTSGTLNSFFGLEAGLYNTSGGYNSFLGSKAGWNNTTGSNNTFIGSHAGNNTTSGSGNTTLGYQAGSSLTTGGNNLVLGNSAGINLATGFNNVLIGRVTVATTTPQINNTIIIADGQGNQRIYADASGVGIGLPANTPAGNRLEIRHGSNNNSGLRFTNLNSTFNPTTTNTKFLTVNGTGDVILQNLPAASGGGTTIAAGTNIAVTGSASSGYTIAANPSLSVSGNSLTISGGNTVTLPSAVDTNTNIYNTDGTLATDRLVHMGGNDLIFDSTSGSKVYIGDAATTSAADFSGSYKLYVEDGIMTEKVKVAIKSSADWADYVFDADYPLMPLGKVADFISANGHLPGVPSAAALACDGIDLAQMQSKQMEKIEELTLYTLAQQREIDGLKAEMAALRAQVKALIEKR